MSSPTLTIQTERKRQVVDITEAVQAIVPSNHSGVAAVSVLHSTAALTTANLDPGTDLDLLDALDRLLPARAWRHPHNPAHAVDHLLASLVGPAITLTVTDGQLRLGTWQRLVLIELDGPRNRSLMVSFI